MQIIRNDDYDGFVVKVQWPIFHASQDGNIVMRYEYEPCFALDSHTDRIYMC